MSDATAGTGGGGIVSSIQALIDSLVGLAHNYLSHVVALGARLYVGLIFFKSGNLGIRDMEGSQMLYEYEYIPNIIANSGVDISFISPQIMTIFGVGGELVLSSLLLLGLATRFSAVGLIVMAGVMQLTYPEHGSSHYAWMVILALLAARGAGAISLDKFVAPKLGFTQR